MDATSHISRHPVKPLGSVLAAVAVATVIALTPMRVAAQSAEAAAPKIPTEADAIDPTQAAEQASALGLTPAEAAVLQKRVDELIVETGGTQIAVNQVLWGDGSVVTTIPPPGEERARRLDEPQAAAAAPWSPPCPVGTLCTYSGQGWLGEMTAWFACKYHGGLQPGKWSSYVNNQTGGARAYFGRKGEYWVKTYRAFWANPASNYLFRANEIRPCYP